MSELKRTVTRTQDGRLLIAFTDDLNFVDLDLLLPEGMQATKTTKEALENFLNLANMVLATPKGWADYCRCANQVSIKSGETMRVALPPLDVHYLGLVSATHGLELSGMIDLFKIVGAYWKATDIPIGLEPGIAAQLWKEGRSVQEIIDLLIQLTGPDGKIKTEAVNAPPPIEALFTQLSLPDGNSFIDPKRCERVLYWVRSCASEDPQFADPNAMRADLQHLGIFDGNGQLVDAAVQSARSFLHEHWQEVPNYAQLWRHIQSDIFGMTPEAKKPDYGVYSQKLAGLIDKGCLNSEIAIAVLDMAKEGTEVPTVQLCQAARLEAVQQMMPAGSQAMAIKIYNDRALTWYAPDGIMCALRDLLQNRDYGLEPAEAEAWLADQGNAGMFRQMNAIFGQRDKWQTLQDVGVLDDQGRWSEQGFMRHQAMIRDLTQSGAAPSLERLRWELHLKHQADQSFPFIWALLNDLMSAQTLRHAKRMASIALSGGLLGDKVSINDMITPQQYKVLRKLGAWISDDPSTYAQSDDLLWLGRLACQHNWQNWEQICSFVSDKLDQEPQPDLVADWVKGLVTFDGLGRYQQGPVKPFGGAKIGRNDPCPCGSSKKYKKCCGL